MSDIPVQNVVAGLDYVFAQVKTLQKQVAELKALTEQQEEEISYLNGQVMSLQ